MALPTPYQEYIFKSRYARWLEAEQRRETWEEAIERYVQFWVGRYQDLFPAHLVRTSIASLQVMPSMRAFMTAGRALDLDELAGYNCSAVAVDAVRAFDEILYVLMCGTGVGFSVEQQFTEQLPDLPRHYRRGTEVVVEDSKIGWATAFREVLHQLYSGLVPSWDVSKVRPAGARLVTFGGRASGPEPLVQLFDFTVRMFMTAQGPKLTPLECHDLVCKVADIVVVGGVRRSALISLSDLSDAEIRDCKSANGWWDDQPQRMLANNSAVYATKPAQTEFLREWAALANSGSGERGIFNRHAVNNKTRSTGRDPRFVYLTNPCAEILLRPNGLCNLTETVVRAGDNLAVLMHKVEVAAILGTFQSTLTNFRYVRDVWRENAEEERLLGVSLTGLMDHEVLRYENEKSRAWLREMKAHAVRTNREWAARLGIPPSAAVTTVKPSGTVSQLVDAASGLHPRYSPYYIRSVRADRKDPLAQFMRAQGFHAEAAVGKEDSTDVFYFPVCAPSGSAMRDDMTAIEQLEHYRMMVEEWCEHNASITVYVRPDEWLEVGAWVHKHFDMMCGVSFLPHTDHVYQQAPYTECTEEQYARAVARLPEFDWAALARFETGDTFSQGREFACTANSCELT